MFRLGNTILDVKSYTQDDQKLETLKTSTHSFKKLRALFLFYGRFNLFHKDFI